jgi:CubicO group peptidase (beta-lactamase class C family)
MKTLFAWMKKTLKVFGIFVLTLIILVNLFILLSGRFYLYKGIANTYLIGKSGPDIYDLDVFPYSTIQKADKAFKWQKNGQYNQYKLTEEEEKLNKKTKTTAFLVFKGDSLVFEKYYENHAPKTVSNIFSGAKTVVGLLIGIAVDEGKIKSLDEPVGNYLSSFKTDDKKNITIRHLMQMASGLDWQESGKNPLSENAESYYGTDLYGLVCRQKGVSKPGLKFNYQSGNSQLLGFIVEKAIGMDLSKYAEKKLWAKIGTESDAFWNLDKENGDEKAFCCLYATAQDFGRIGRLIMNKGNWNGEQIVSEKFMNEMFTNRAAQTEEGIKNTCYAMHIWTYHDGEDQIYYCRGILGQYIAIIPSKNLMFVRLGHKRSPKMEYEDYLKLKKAGKKPSIEKIDHPKDFLQYIKTAKRITE